MGVTKQKITAINSPVLQRHLQEQVWALLFYPHRQSYFVVAQSPHDLTPLVRFETHLCCVYVDITEGLDLRLVNICVPSTFVLIV